MHRGVMEDKSRQFIPTCLHIQTKSLTYNRDSSPKSKENQRNLPIVHQKLPEGIFNSEG